jgi:hypothetical protein
MMRSAILFAASCDCSASFLPVILYCLTGPIKFLPKNDDINNNSILEGGSLMAISPISIAGQSVNSSTTVPGASAVGGNTAAAKQIGDAAMYEKTNQTASDAKNSYTRDAATLSEINKQVDAKLASLRATVENLVSMQSVKLGEAQGLSYDQILAKYDGKMKKFYQSLEVDDATRLNAQQEISEEGFWGVKQTAARTIEFAKALAGGDPSKIALLRNAIEEGYKAAEKSWGGELPDISQKTQAAVLKGLDDWACEGAS